MPADAAAVAQTSANSVAAVLEAMTNELTAAAAQLRVRADWADLAAAPGTRGERYRDWFRHVDPFGLAVGFSIGSLAFGPLGPLSGVGLGLVVGSAVARGGWDPLLRRYADPTAAGIGMVLRPLDVGGTAAEAFRRRFYSPKFNWLLTPRSRRPFERVRSPLSSLLDTRYGSTRTPAGRIPIPPAWRQAGTEAIQRLHGSERFARVTATAEKWSPRLGWVGAGIDAYSQVRADWNDKGLNTAEKVARAGVATGTRLVGGVAGAQAGASAGAWIGGAIGTMILPGVGTVAGAAVGAAIGGVTGAFAGSSAAGWVSDRVLGIKDATKKTKKLLKKLSPFD